MARLEYEISVTGEASLARAFAGIERRAAAHQQKLEGMALSSRRSATRERALTGVRAPRGMSETARGFDQIGRAARAADLKLHRERLADIKKEEQERIRSATRATRMVAREEARLSRSQEHAVAARKRTYARIGRGFASGTRNAVGAVATGVGMVGGLLGGVGIAGAVEEQMRVTKGIGGLAAQAGGGPGMREKLSKASMSARGFSREDTVQAMEGFISLTGATKEAAASMKDFGDISLATNTELADLSEAAGNVYNQLADSIQDPTERLKVMNDVMRATAGMGAVGAVEVKDLAKEMAGLAAQAGQFEGKAEDVIKYSVALAEMARRKGGATSAAEAVTSVERMSTDIIQNRKRFKAQGVDVYAKGSHGTRLRSQSDILAQTLVKTGGNLGKMQELFGIRSGRVTRGLARTYTEAVETTKGTQKEKEAAGVAAVTKAMEMFTKATVSAAEVQKRADERMKDADKQVVETMKSFNSAIGEAMMPVIQGATKELGRLTPQLRDAASAAGQMALWAAKNPLAGVGALVGGFLLKELAAAAIGTTLGAAAGLAGAAILAAVYEALKLKSEVKGEWGKNIKGGFMEAAESTARGEGPWSAAKGFASGFAKTEVSQQDVAARKDYVTSHGGGTKGEAALKALDVAHAQAAMNLVTQGLQALAVEMAKVKAPGGTPNRNDPIVSPRR